jgi:hypothetical protein
LDFTFKRLQVTRRLKKALANAMSDALIDRLAPSAAERFPRLSRSASDKDESVQERYEPSRLFHAKGNHTHWKGGPALVRAEALDGTDSIAVFLNRSEGLLCYVTVRPQSPAHGVVVLYPDIATGMPVFSAR